MPPPVHIVGKINMARIHIQKELDELLDMLHSDGLVIAMFSNPNVDLVQTLEVWKFSSQTFIEYMFPKITYINFQVFHPQPNKSLVQNNIDDISHNRELCKLLKDNLYFPNCCSLYSFEQLEQLLTDFIKCLQAHYICISLVIYSHVSICHFLPALPTPLSTPVHFSFTYLSNILSL